MDRLLVLGIVGFAAQLINSSLGMGYGVSSTTFLLMAGTAPAVASATVNLSQVGSQLVSGYAHWRLGNVDLRVVLGIAVPGAAGAFAGALFLSSISTEFAAPMVASILLVLGTYILARFTFRGTPRLDADRPLRSQFLTPLGLVAGFLNSTGGGGWGPLGTGALLASGRLEPRKVIGSISAGEFIVVVAGSAGFAVGLGFGGINVSWVAVMLLGGVLAAPIAAWLARHIPARLLGPLVGGLIIVTNLRTLLHILDASELAWYAVYAVALPAWALAVAVTARAVLRERAMMVTCQREMSSGPPPGGSRAPSTDAS